MTTVAIEASSRIASSIAMAAVGRKNWQGRPPGRDLEREGRADEQEPDQDQRRCRDARAPGRNRQIQPSSIADDEDGAGQPADEARDVRAALARQAERRRSSRCRSVVSGSPFADDDLALEDLRPMTGCDRLRGAWPSPGSVSSWLNDEFGTTSGLISSAASIRSGVVEAAGHQAGEPRPGLGDLGVAQLGAQQRRRGPAPTRSRTAAQRAGVERERASSRGSSDRPGTAVSSSDARLLGAEVGRERRVDARDALLEGELLLVGDGDRASRW